MASEFLWCTGYMAEHEGLEGFALCVFEGWLVLRTLQVL